MPAPMDSRIARRAERRGRGRERNVIHATRSDEETQKAEKAETGLLPASGEFSRWFIRSTLGYMHTVVHDLLISNSNR